MSLFEISRLCICATGLYGTAICEQQSGHLRVYHVKNERNRNEREKRDRNFFVIVRKASEKLLLNKNMSVRDKPFNYENHTGSKYFVRIANFH